jgi:serine/threonine protein kinase
LEYPFKNETLYGIAEEILSDSAFPRIPKQYSDDLNDIIQLMLIRNMKKRPSVAELLEMDYFKRVWEYFKSGSKQDNFSFTALTKQNNYV